MIAIIHNNKYDDSISFEIEDTTPVEIDRVLNLVRKRGWEDVDCWSEVIK